MTGGFEGRNDMILLLIKKKNHFVVCIKVAKNSCCDVDEPRVCDTE